MRELLQAYCCSHQKSSPSESYERLRRGRDCIPRAISLSKCRCERLAQQPPPPWSESLSAWLIQHHPLYKWPYTWVTGAITPLSGVIRIPIIGRSPPCMEVEKYNEFRVSSHFIGTWVERCRVAQKPHIMRKFISLSHEIPWRLKHVELEWPLWESRMSVQGMRLILKQYLSTSRLLQTLSFAASSWTISWTYGKL